MASILGYQIQGDKRWSDGQWCLFSRVPQTIRRFRDAVKAIPKTRSPMKWRLSLPKWFDSGLGNYYAYAADSRLMDSLDAFIYQEVWKYCHKAEDGKTSLQPVRCLVTFKSVTSKLVLS